MKTKFKDGIETLVNSVEVPKVDKTLKSVELKIKRKKRIQIMRWATVAASVLLLIIVPLKGSDYFSNDTGGVQMVNPWQYEITRDQIKEQTGIAFVGLPGEDVLSLYNGEDGIIIRQQLLAEETSYEMRSENLTSGDYNVYDTYEELYQNLKVTYYSNEGQLIKVSWDSNGYTHEVQINQGADKATFTQWIQKIEKKL